MPVRSAQKLVPDLRLASQLRPRPIEWLWPHRIPVGKLTVLFGDPGIGKSLLIADLAARVSANLPFPSAQPPFLCDGASSLRAGIARSLSSPTLSSRSLPAAAGGSVAPSLPPPSGVLLITDESRPADSLLPRLAAAGAKLDNIRTFHGLFDTLPGQVPDLELLDRLPSSAFRLPVHEYALTAGIKRLNQPRLVVLDPLSAFVPLTDSNSDLTLALRGLACVAAQLNVAIIGVCSTTKSHGPALNRVRGSVSIVAAARSVLMLAPDPRNPARRLLVPLKNINGPLAPPLAFTISTGPRIVWEKAAAAPGERSSSVREGSAAGAAVSNLKSPIPNLRPQTPSAWTFTADLLSLPVDSASALAEACDWLLDLLSKIPLTAIRVMDLARRARISLGTLRRAKRILAVRSIRSIRNERGIWLWELPARPQKPASLQERLRTAREKLRTFTNRPGAAPPPVAPPATTEPSALTAVQDAQTGVSPCAP